MPNAEVLDHNHNLDWDVAFTPVAELIYDQITTVIGPPIRRGGSWLGPTVDVIWQHAVYRNPCSHLLLYPDIFYRMQNYWTHYYWN